MWKPGPLPEGFVTYVKSIYEPMAETAKPGFLEDNLRRLYSLIYNAVDFHNYLETADMVSPAYNDKVYMCDSIFSCIESFTYVNGNYSVLIGAMDSELKWGLTSLNSLKERFNSMYQEFLSEQNFEKKCRLLLDLFKLQIVFFGMVYD